MKTLLIILILAVAALGGITYRLAPAPWGEITWWIAFLIEFGILWAFLHVLHYPKNPPGSSLFDTDRR